MCTLLGGPCMHIAYFEPVDCPRVSQLGVTQLSLLDLTEHNELFTVIHRLNWKTRHVMLLLDDNSFCLKALYNWLSEVLAEAHASMLWWYSGTERDYRMVIPWCFDIPWYWIIYHSCIHIPCGSHGIQLRLENGSICDMVLLWYVYKKQYLSAMSIKDCNTMALFQLVRESGHLVFLFSYYLAI